MSKRTVFTTLTALPPGITRSTVMETLRTHTEMIDLNPLVQERHIIKPPTKASAEEYHCIWYQLTDRVQYLPGNLVAGKVSYDVCFHDLPNGLQTHCYAPLGLDIKGKWTLGGSLPGESREAVEIGLGVPKEGLWLREDVDMRCNMLMTSFVKKTLKKAHASLVDRLVEKAHLVEAKVYNERLMDERRRSSSSANVHGRSESWKNNNATHPAFSETGSSVSPYQSERISYQSRSSSYSTVEPNYTIGNPYRQEAAPSEQERPAELDDRPVRPYIAEME